MSELSVQQAVEVIARGIQLIHAVPIEDCPFFADWTLRLAEGEARARAGLIDESDFDEDNRGRSIDDILLELKSLPPLPDVACLTHGDACLQNFLAHDGQLSGIVDVGRAGNCQTRAEAVSSSSVRGISGGYLVNSRCRVTE